MSDDQPVQDWSVTVDLSKVPGWDPSQPPFPWAVGPDARFSDVDGTLVAEGDEIVLVSPVETNSPEREWAPATPGMIGTVLGFAESPEDLVWVDLNCPSPERPDHIFATRSQVRFVRTRDEWMAEAQNKRGAWGR